jgi:hypothetical protein
MGAGVVIADHLDAPGEHGRLYGPLLLAEALCELGQGRAVALVCPDLLCEQPRQFKRPAARQFGFRPPRAGSGHLTRPK